MRPLIPLLVAFLGLATIPFAEAAATRPSIPARFADPASSILWYEQPARTWMTEALPIGGGSLGAMLFGLTDVERLQFNHNTLWTGNEKDTGAYQAFGDVFIRLGHSAPSDYRRDLDLDRATASVTYKQDGVTYRRTAFASHPAGVIIYHFTADKPGAYSGRLWLAPMQKARVVAEADRIDLDGRLGKTDCASPPVSV